MNRNNMLKWKIICLLEFILDIVVRDAIIFIGALALFIYGYINLSIFIFLNIISLFFICFGVMKKEKLISIKEDFLEINNLLKQSFYKIPFNKLKKVLIKRKYIGYDDKVFVELFFSDANNKDSVLNLRIYPMEYRIQELISIIEKKYTHIEIVVKDWK